MKIEIAQIATRAADFKTTSRRMLECARRADAKGADAVIFSYTCLTGAQTVPYPAEQSFLLDLTECLTSLAEQLPCACLVPVSVEVHDETYHEVMLLNQGEVTPLKFFSYLSGSVGGLLGQLDGGTESLWEDINSSTEETDDPSEAAMARLPQFELGGMSCGIALSYEELDAYLDSGVDLDVLFFISSYNYALDDTSSMLGGALAENRFMRDARELGAWFVGVGSLGGYGTRIFTGSSFILSPQGELAVSAPAFEEAQLNFELTPRDSELTVEPVVREVYNRPLYLWETLALGLRDFVLQEQTQEVALMLDGRLTSSLLAVLAVDALGPTHVHVLMGPFKDEALLKAQKELCRQLRIDYHALNHDLTDIKDAALAHDIAQAHLAALARQYEAVPLATWDRTGLALEATQVGTEVGLLAPLGEVYRTDIVELARLRNTISPVIPESCFEALEAPHLAVERPAELSCETFLAQIDEILAGYNVWGRSLYQLEQDQNNSGLAKAVIAQFEQSSAGRSSKPSVLQLSSRSLLDVTLPMGCAWRDSSRPREDLPFGEELLSRLGSQLSALTPEEVRSAGRDMHDTLGFIADMELSHLGESSADDATLSSNGRWSNPFSEN